MRNIVLVGFMGTGKTAVAKAISRELNLKYVSTDDLIEKLEKTSISDIFARKGEQYFREAEKKVVNDVSNMKNAVIDAGGGVVMDAENVRNLKEKGIMICLWAEPETILQRTAKYPHRPLLNVEKPLERIRELMALRKAFYERADYHVHTSRMSLEEVINEVKQIVTDGPANR